MPAFNNECQVLTSKHKAGLTSRPPPVTGQNTSGTPSHGNLCVVRGFKLFTLFQQPFNDHDKLFLLDGLWNLK